MMASFCRMEFVSIPLPRTKTEVVARPVVPVVVARPTQPGRPSQAGAHTESRTPSAAYWQPACQTSPDGLCHIPSLTPGAPPQRIVPGQTLGPLMAVNLQLQNKLAGLTTASSCPPELGCFLVFSRFVVSSGEGR